MKIKDVSVILTTQVYTVIKDYSSYVYFIGFRFGTKCVGNKNFIGNVL